MYQSFFERTEKSGYSHGTNLYVKKFWLVKMPLCERPAGQSMKNPTSPSHVELRLNSPLAAL